MPETKYLEAVYATQQTTEMARVAAIRKHGQLKGGMDRWIHHLEEECREAVDEMHALNYYHSPEEYEEHKQRLIIELAQVSQLAQSMMALLYMNREKEVEETWAPPQVDMNLGVGTDPLPPDWQEP